MHYAALCERKLWWFTHGMEQEHSSDTVADGRYLHEASFPRRENEVFLDGRVRLDGLEVSGRKGVEAVVTVHEVKRSRAKHRAQRLQLLYYLYLLQNRGVRNVRGVLEYPKEKRREQVTLTDTGRQELQQVLARIEAVRAMATPPVVPEPMSMCRECAYQELCWG
ncbi:MAG: CRISPR-associated protein Cas4 [Chthonomonadales bacterium]